MASRRTRRQQRLTRQRVKRTKEPKHAPQTEKPVVKRGDSSLFYRIYHDNYKKLLLIPFILLLIALLQIGFQVSTTGDFLNKGVSLKGGLTLTVPVNDELISIDELQEAFAAQYSKNEVLVRGISEFGTLKGVSIEASGEASNSEEMEELEKQLVLSLTAWLPNTPEEYSVEIVGPSLGASFFQQTLRAVIIAFLLMGMVVFFYFGENGMAKIIATILSIITSVLVFNASGSFTNIFALLFGLTLLIIYVKYSPPSSAVILAAFSDIVMTLAVVNLLGIKISTAGIAAFLMLIGYSVDTDILLSTRVLRHTHGTVYERILSSMRTGVTMTLTSALASLIALIFTQSETIRQIMLIILIGLIADLINTWFQNAGIIRMYAEKRQ